jgi:acetyl-CoA carboxylase beta subunit
MGGSMSGVVGERFVRNVNHRTRSSLHLHHRNGGASKRLGDAMAKTNASLTRLAKKGLLHRRFDRPTMGGVRRVSPLWVMVIAEPKALIGFAGPSD